MKNTDNFKNKNNKVKNKKVLNIDDESSSKLDQNTKDNIEFQNFDSSKKHRIYLSYSARLVIGFILLFITLTFAALLLRKSISYSKEKSIKYNESSNIDYRVYLLPNDFYEVPYLEKNMLYVASLIDKIELDFNYVFIADSNLTTTFNYDIVANLTITDKSGSRSYYEKEYVLLNNKEFKMKNSNTQQISEKLNIDYSYYNSLANSFRSSFGLETDSKLNIFMRIHKQSDEQSDYKLEEKSNMGVSIPLSEKSVDIRINSNDINNSNIIKKSEGIKIGNSIVFIFSILLLILAFLLIIWIIKKIALLGTKKSLYDKTVTKLLKEYDRLIAESANIVSFKNNQIIKIKKFTELLDIHDNLQLPIIYYPITPHHKCYFYINHNNIIYLYVLKAVDLEITKKN